MRIQNKLFLTSICGSALLIGIMFLLIQWSVDRGMLEYANTRLMEEIKPITGQLADYYRENGGWEPLQGDHRGFYRLIHEAAPGLARHPPPRHDRRRAEPPGIMPPPREFRDRRRPPKTPPFVLVDPNMQVIAGHKRPQDSYFSLPVVHAGETVALLQHPRLRQITEDFDLSFLSQQREALALICLVILVLSALISFPAAKHLVTPIRRLADSIRALTLGDYAIELNSQRRDELGELARDFNQLSKTLANNDKLRKQWLADTSHELRTPVTIMRGELEAIQDGVRPMDNACVDSIHQEILLLGKLIEDLHELNSADIGAMEYRMESLTLQPLIEDALKQHELQLSAKALQVDRQLQQSPVTIWADSMRIAQLLNNLLSNSINYTDPGGKIRMTLEQQDAYAVLCIEDSHPGVPDEALPKLFDHLYRVEGSRNRNTGGSGLGLAICRKIVDAHNGHIEAGHSKLGGIRITVKLLLK